MSHLPEPGPQCVHQRDTVGGGEVDGEEGLNTRTRKIRSAPHTRRVCRADQNQSDYTEWGRITCRKPVSITSSYRRTWPVRVYCGKSECYFAGTILAFINRMGRMIAYEV